MSNNKENAIDIIATSFKQCRNPDDLKSSIIGKVVKLDPIIVSVSNGYVLLKENDDLEISEWFRFRCNIDNDKKVTKTKTVIETHSYTKTECLLPESIKTLANAILALKCNLAVGDYVTVASLEESGKYVLLDKVV